MKETRIEALEHSLQTRAIITEFLVDNYKTIPESDLEKRARYQIFLKKHFIAIAELCDQIEDRINEAMTILENKRTA